MHARQSGYCGPTDGPIADANQRKTIVILTLLVIVFVLVFGFIAWRVIMNASSAGARSEDVYTCPVCNDQNCVCDKKEKR